MSVEKSWDAIIHKSRKIDSEFVNRHIPFDNGKRNVKTHCCALDEIREKNDNFPHARRTPKLVVWGLKQSLK